MNLFKRLADLFGGGPSGGSAPIYTFSVRCKRCGEVLAGRVGLANELSAEYPEQGDGPPTYVCRKGLVGSEHCFETIEVTLWFDANRRLTDRQAVGGEFVD